jgi:chemotaxis protein CheC
MPSQEEKMDALREIAHIGAGNASNSLSEMAGTNIEVEFPEIEKYPIEDVPDIIGKKDDIVTAASIQMHTELAEADDNNLGRIALIIDYEGSKELASMISPVDEDAEGLTEMDISSLKELENVLAGTCLEAISDMIGRDLYESTPFFHVDMMGAVMQGMVLDMVETHDEIIVFKTRFQCTEEVNAYFMFFFTEKGYEAIIDNIEEF